MQNQITVKNARLMNFFFRLSKRAKKTVRELEMANNSSLDPGKRF